MRRTHSSTKDDEMCTSTRRPHETDGGCNRVVMNKQLALEGKLMKGRDLVRDTQALPDIGDGGQRSRLPRPHAGHMTQRPSRHRFLNDWECAFGAIQMLPPGTLSESMFGQQAHRSQSLHVHITYFDRLDSVHADRNYKLLVPAARKHIGQKRRVKAQPPEVRDGTLAETVEEQTRARIVARCQKALARERRIVPSRTRPTRGRQREQVNESRAGHLLKLEARPGCKFGRREERPQVPPSGDVQQNGGQCEYHHSQQCFQLAEGHMLQVWRHMSARACVAGVGSSKTSRRRCPSVKKMMEERLPTQRKVSSPAVWAAVSSMVAHGRSPSQRDLGVLPSQVWTPNYDLTPMASAGGWARSPGIGGTPRRHRRLSMFGISFVSYEWVGNWQRRSSRRTLHDVPRVPLVAHTTSQC